MHTKENWFLFPASWFSLNLSLTFCAGLAGDGGVQSDGH